VGSELRFLERSGAVHCGRGGNGKSVGKGPGGVLRFNRGWQLAMAPRAYKTSLLLPFAVLLKLFLTVSVMMFFLLCRPVLLDGFCFPCRCMRARGRGGRVALAREWVGAGQGTVGKMSMGDGVSTELTRVTHGPRMANFPSVSIGSHSSR
jgi:hypothetical protein